MTEKLEKWLNFKEDYGIRLFSLMIIIYNGVLFLASVAIFKMMVLALVPVVISVFLLFICGRLCERGDYLPLISLIFLILSTVVINYFLIGELDRSIGGLERKDALFVLIDHFFYNMPVATFIDRISFRVLGDWQFILYDFLMSVYFVYFLIPVLGTILVYKHYALEGAPWKVSRYAFSFLLSYMINMYLYLVVPVTGPQYFIKDSFSEKLPLSSYGQILFNHIASAQQTFIDCFPSGHLWMTLLATIWLFYINHSIKYLAFFITICMVLATLGLRYHYTTDLLVAIPFAFIVFWSSFKFLKD